MEREKKNAMAREKRPQTTEKKLLGDLRKNHLFNEELKERLSTQVTHQISSLKFISILFLDF